jgi:pimeloyl-ACP methyl ester carboxylesterase
VATFVTVHGAWTGGWSWRAVARALRADGHEVFPVTLTGAGERVHLATPTVDLHTHVTDVVNVLRYEDLDDVVLVGHSYGGLVITAVAERLPARVTHLVYLDAFVPRDGQRFADLLPAGALAGLEARARAEGEGWRLPPDSPDADHRTPFLMAALYQTVRLSDPISARVPRTYIACTESWALPIYAHLRAAADRARAESWGYHELPTGHYPLETMPDAVTAILRDLA